MYPRGPEFREEIIKKLRNVDGLLVWDRKDIPEEYHYKNSKNTPPILVLAKPQNIILLSPPEYQKPDGGRCSGNGRSPLKRQSHYRSVHRVMDQMRKGLAGYDPDEEDMRGIFMAKGPGKICLQKHIFNFLFFFSFRFIIMFEMYFSLSACWLRKPPSFLYVSTKL